MRRKAIGADGIIYAMCFLLGYLIFQIPDFESRKLLVWGIMCLLFRRVWPAP